MSIIVEPDANALSRKGADIFIQVAAESVALRGRFVVAISGGSTPRPLHRLLREEPYRSKIPWSRTHIFWVDERCVPVDDPASNYGLARVDFIDKIPIPGDQIHPMSVDLVPEEGATAYQRELVHYFQSQPSKIPVLDFICLGIGTDGHTASLFPDQSALSEKEQLIIAVKGGNPYVSRLTMTFPLINHAREIVFLVSGQGKAPILKAILEGPPDRFPAQMIQPLNGRLTWLLDQEAASLLSL